MLIVISLLQLSFTFVVKNYEQKAINKVEKAVAASNPTLDKNSEAFKLLVSDQSRHALDSLGSQKIYNVGFKNFTYQGAKEQELNLGLDLQGGMNVVLEVGTDQLVRSMSNNPNDPTLIAAVNEAISMKANSQDNFISLFSQAYNKQNPNGKLANLYVKPGVEGITFNSTNNQVIDKIRSEAKVAVKNTFNVINKRIDKFGVSSPNVNLDENKDIITVELAGVQNPEKVRKFLQSTAKLEFWETYSNYEITKNLVDADKALKKYLSGDKSVTDTASSSKSDSTKLATKNVKGSDTGSLAGLLKTDDKKLNDTSTKGLNDDQKIAKYHRENPLISLMAQPIEPQNNPETGRPYENAQVAYIFAKDTAQMNAYLNLDIVKNIFPKNLKFLYGMPSRDIKEKDKNIFVMYAIKTVNGTDKPKLGGEHVTETRADFDPMTGEPEVTMSMDQTGAMAWQKLTGSNVGKPVAIVLDDLVYSAPAPRGEIAGGRSSISGSFTPEEAKDLANILKTGKLDAPARIVQEQVVGPSLGAENIAAGKMSFLLAFIVIFVLMLVYYNTAGIVANIALILNLLFTIGVLSALHATLTMAGIAGLVLTIGMAVDTNVIIFERIKEELAAGKNHVDAVNEGYKRSLAPVLDGHITVLLTSIILYYFGLGPVLGFATTQILGILLSLFCGILVSRLITDMFMKNGKHLEYFTGLSKSIFKKAHFKFIEFRKYAYMLSVIVLLLGIGSFFNGFKYGIEFIGGRSFTVKLNKPVKTELVREGLKSVFNEYPDVKTIGTHNEIDIATSYLKAQNGPEVEGQVAAKLYEGLSNLNLVEKGLTPEQFKAKYVSTSQTVQPTISDDLKKGAYYATAFSIIAIFIYIFLRFRKWQYSAGTVVALLHDVFVTLAVFSFLKNVVPFSLEINQHFIAAILTVIGFSMNDTVIVFDRIREYFRKRPGASKTDVINEAINDTMSRTIMTSLTVFVTLLILFLFGGETTKGFAFAMLIGVVTGTYSSIFVAAPILVDLDKDGSLSQEVDKDLKIKNLKELA